MESYAERLSLALDEALWHLLYPDASAAIPAYWNKSLMNTIARLTDITQLCQQKNKIIFMKQRRILRLRFKKLQQ